MNDSSSLAWTVSRSQGPLVLVHAYDDAERDEVKRLFEVVAPTGTLIAETTSLEVALREKDKLVFLISDDEVECLRALDRRRDELEPRARPLVVFIVKGGEASRALGDLPALASFVRGHEIDPREDDRVDASQRADFETRTGLTPAAWLAKYRSGEFSDDADSNALAAEALLYEDEG